MRIPTTNNRYHFTRKTIHQYTIWSSYNRTVVPDGPVEQVMYSDDRVEIRSILTAGHQVIVEMSVVPKL